MFSAWIRNQWHRQMGFITTLIYSWSKGTEGNSLEEQSFLPALLSVVVIFPLMWSETTWESFCSQWPFPIFLNCCGNKAASTPCPFPSSYPWQWDTLWWWQREESTPLLCLKSAAICGYILHSPDNFYSPSGTPSKPVWSQSLSESLQGPIQAPCKEDSSLLNPYKAPKEISGTSWITGLLDSPNCWHSLQAVGCKQKNFAEDFSLLCLWQNVSWTYLF